MVYQTQRADFHRHGPVISVFRGAGESTPQRHPDTSANTKRRLACLIVFVDPFRLENDHAMVVVAIPVTCTWQSLPDTAADTPNGAANTR